MRLDTIMKFVESHKENISVQNFTVKTETKNPNVKSNEAVNNFIEHN